mmetsp:Transcript_80436/g.176340  ORF Transcript_80436/g.176340 Transcript_80436/m.176340 type:complete len:224 (-) Transcript_80436:215-886(-)
MQLQQTLTEPWIQPGQDLAEGLSGKMGLGHGGGGVAAVVLCLAARHVARPVVERRVVEHVFAAAAVAGAVEGVVEFLEVDKAAAEAAEAVFGVVGVAAVAAAVTQGAARAAQSHTAAAAAAAAVGMVAECVVVYVDVDVVVAVALAGEDAAGVVAAIAAGVAADHPKLSMTARRSGSSPRASFRGCTSVRSAAPGHQLVWVALPDTILNDSNLPSSKSMEHLH